MESDAQSASAATGTGITARQLSRVYATPPAAPGFIGAGHTAVEVLAPTDLAVSDPFVLLMDDRLDIPTRRQIGGAHPHAGLETVTQHGPFVAGSRAEIVELYRRFRAGEFSSMSQLARDQRHQRREERTSA